MNRNQIPFTKQTQMLNDPGDAGEINIGVYNAASCSMKSSGGNQTRTVVAPTSVDQRLTLWLDTDGGDIVVTVNNGHLVTTITFDDEGDIAQLYAISIGGVTKWIQLLV
jgi:hypothetical protein